MFSASCFPFLLVVVFVAAWVWRAIVGWSQSLDHLVHALALALFLLVLLLEIVGQWSLNLVQPTILVHLTVTILQYYTGWATYRRGQDFPWKIQSEWQRTEINVESTSMVWPTPGLRTAKELNRTDTWLWLSSRVVSVLDSGAEGPEFKLQPWHCQVTVLGKLFTPTVPLFTKQ